MEETCNNCLYSADFYKCPDNKYDGYCECWKDDGYHYMPNIKIKEPEVQKKSKWAGREWKL